MSTTQVVVEFVPDYGPLLNAEASLRSIASDIGVPEEKAVAAQRAIRAQVNETKTLEQQIKTLADRQRVLERLRARSTNPAKLRTYNSELSKNGAALRRLRLEQKSISEQLDDLRKKEALLLAGRKRANDPRLVRRYEAQIDRLREKIERLNATERNQAGARSRSARGGRRRGGGGGAGAIAGSLVGGFVGGAAVGALQGATSALRGFLASSIDAAGGIEATRIVFENFTGSAQKSTEVLEKLEEFSIKTPFTPAEVNRSAQALLPYIENTEQLIPTLSRIGDVASGLNIPFSELSMLYGRAAADQVLYTETLNQFADRGIPIYQELGKILAEDVGQATALTRREITELASQGKVSFSVLEEAFTSLTGEGGKFADLTERQAKTFQGLRSTAQGVLDGLARAIGERLLPAAKSALDTFIAFTSALTGFLAIPASEKLDQERRSVLALGAAITAANTPLDTRKRLLNELNTTLEQNGLPILDAEKVANDDVRKSIERLNTAFLDRIKLLASREYLTELQEQAATIQRTIDDLTRDRGEIIASVQIQAPVIEDGVPTDETIPILNIDEQAQVNKIDNRVQVLREEVQRIQRRIETEITRDDLPAAATGTEPAARPTESPAIPTQIASQAVSQAAALRERIQEQLANLEIKLRIEEAGGEGTVEGLRILRDAQIEATKQDKLFQELRQRNEERANEDILRERVDFAERIADVAATSSTATLEAQRRIIESSDRIQVENLSELTQNALIEQRNIELKELQNSAEFRQQAIEDQQRSEREIYERYQAEILQVQRLALQRQKEITAELNQQQPGQLDPSATVESLTQITEVTIQNLERRRDEELEVLREAEEFRAASTERQKEVERQVVDAFSVEIEKIRTETLSRQRSIVEQFAAGRTEGIEVALDRERRLYDERLVEIREMLRTSQQLERISVEERASLLGRLSDESTRVSVERLLSAGDYSEAAVEIERDANAQIFAESERLNERLLELAQQRQAANEDRIGELEDKQASGELGDAEQGELDARLSVRQVFAGRVLDITERLAKAQIEAEQQVTEKQEAELEKRKEKLEEAYSVIAGLAGESIDLAGSINDVLNEANAVQLGRSEEEFASRRERLQEQLEAEQEATEERLSNERMSESRRKKIEEESQQRRIEIERKITQIERQEQEERAEIQRQQAARTQSIALFTTILQQAQAVAAVWGAPSTLPSPFDVIFKVAASASAAAAVAAQISRVRSASLGFFKGGMTDDAAPERGVASRPGDVALVEIGAPDHTGARVRGVVHEREYVAPATQVDGQARHLIKYLDTERKGVADDRHLLTYILTQKPALAERILAENAQHNYRTLGDVVDRLGPARRQVRTQNINDRERTDRQRKLNEHWERSILGLHLSSLLDAPMLPQRSDKPTNGENAQHNYRTPGDVVDKLGPVRRQVRTQNINDRERTDRQRKLNEHWERSTLGLHLSSLLDAPMLPQRSDKPTNGENAQHNYRTPGDVVDKLGPVRRQVRTQNINDRERTDRQRKLNEHWERSTLGLHLSSLLDAPMLPQRSDKPTNGADPVRGRLHFVLSRDLLGAAAAEGNEPSNHTLSAKASLFEPVAPGEAMSAATVRRIPRAPVLPQRAEIENLGGIIDSQKRGMFYDAVQATSDHQLAARLDDIQRILQGIPQEVARQNRQKMGKDIGFALERLEETVYDSSAKQIAAPA